MVSSESKHPESNHRHLIAAVLFLAALFTAAFRINYGDADSSWPAGPGITTDEVINVAQGVYLNDQILKHGPGLWIPSTTEDVFADPIFLPDHPPFGRAVLGFCEMAFSGLLPAPVDGQVSIMAARMGPCLMFAATVAILFLVVSSRYDQWTAVLSAVFLMLMPRVVAHARLGTLETATTMAWLLALAVPLMKWTSDESKLPPYRTMIIAGAFWGLLLLTKMQAVLMMPVIGLWTVWQFQFRFAVPILVSGIVGLTVFFVGWPWLLLDPAQHVKEYFLRADERTPLYVMYFGERYLDKEVPFHFPFLMTAITVPFVVLLGMVARFVQRRFDRFEQLAMLSVAAPLIVFALPGTAVYDGTRLFLIIMPLVAFLAARGIMAFLHNSRHWVRGCSAVALFAGVLIPLQAVLSPFGLTSYGIQAGGTAGAAAIGMETDYWGVGLNADAWQQIPDGATVMVAPISHQFQLRDLMSLHPEIQRRNIKLVPYRYTPDEKGLLLCIHRLADLRPVLTGIPDGAKLMGSARYGSTDLMTLLDLADVQWETVPDWPER